MTELSLRQNLQNILHRCNTNANLIDTGGSSSGIYRSSKDESPESCENSTINSTAGLAAGLMNRVANTSGDSDMNESRRSTPLPVQVLPILV